MYRVVVEVTGTKRATPFVFHRKLKAEAQRLAEEVAQSGFWVPKARPATLMPPSRIASIEMTKLRSEPA
jgi:hypothetical protein